MARKIGMGLLAAVTTFFWVGVSQAMPRAENLSYDLNFLRMQAARAEIRLSEGAEPGVYLAEMRVTPAAFLRQVGPYEWVRFTSTLRFLPTENRFRLERWEKVAKGRKDYRGYYEFDYDKAEVAGQGFLNEKPLAREVFPLRPGTVFFDDFLCFYFNLRMGFYDALKPGEEVVIHGIPNEKRADFALRREPVPAGEKSYRIAVDRKVMGVRVDQVLFKLSHDDLPFHAIIRDVLGWGDIVTVLKTDGKEQRL